ncbi:MAG: Helix-turn-helix domain protein [Candidatus Gottesmanbacteria bacterium GW2011_GWB1_43_11]|uniref:Helix-turn-helix domain protein n=1 Tax=Candidatus Gottesmanbacteria bacterium GW2011_GWB1_43_11 TaxID=1618446 RepID=A0A0G1CM13_9BACT|nr:MAG: Helix-turn-helix domain protein [Candidatus Gottesmanbacteria bacterium GW2011_GWA2_42_16]KKS55418.1 MAG: Helix-turn-helix domain protein [Candidatus Gottesmanbacteria bacterium GW2011_GWA1_42_26]KKS81880.1 MAG: DNA-binding helix-turn-helix protein [Candidatus Gottesmanbacteria bacterium GW2011_GWC1_43_10]KKS86800.1 MAG: Helix-turn-helix domain protein [Candidatus Gottesmanbacteria bacterium GW2011_GWB1_43_11]OGG10594.1 MAG: hypothetical protein A2699_01745 [Candidatus Gottesmanbacteria
MIEQRVPGTRQSEDPSYKIRQGGLLLRVAGDIKRHPDFLASELKLPLPTVKSILAGEASQDETNQLIEKMVATYPVSRLALEVVRDDTDGGVIVKHAQESATTSRIFDRKDKNGMPTPYYEYRDAAMSDLGPFRPEWIKELREVTTEDGNDPDIAYNTGHFMHQLTMYVGPVNLHWKDDSGSHTLFMDTGDSNYGTPYVPHSFTTRDTSKEAYIMAVTFSGKLGSAVQQELSVLRPDEVNNALLDLTAKKTSFSDLLRVKTQDSFMTDEVLSRMTGLSINKIHKFLSGRLFPSINELEIIAAALKMNARDLYPPTPVKQMEVVVERVYSNKKWVYPSEVKPHYEIRKLAGSTKMAEAKAFSLNPTQSDEVTADGDLDIVTPMNSFQN